MNILPESALDKVETLMLDMDGTLLDLAYDNYMWQEHIPRHYAIENDMLHDDAKQLLADKFALAQGDLRWYCLDHWSEHLGIDVVQLHHDASHRIGYLPGALKFLKRVCGEKLRVLLVTNSHRETLNLKDAVTGLCEHFDGIHSSHDYGHAKESQKFWSALQEDVGFESKSTLFVDDSSYVLRSAHQFGIGHLLKVTQPDTRKAAKNTSEFSGVQRVAEILT
jgi:HAD superfamily hydrolase (TIGR01509 family)